MHNMLQKNHRYNGSGSIISRHGSSDPDQNETDPQH